MSSDKDTDANTGEAPGADADAEAAAGAEKPGAEKPGADPNAEADDEIVLPRSKPGRSLRHLRGVDLMRIGMFATLLVVILVMRQPCADGMARFIGSFDQPDAGRVEVDGGAVGSDPRIGEFRRLTDEEIRAIFSGDAGSLLDDGVDGGR